MEELIRQIRVAASHGLYYLALYGALTLPDICAALGSANGRASGPKYKRWLSENVPTHADQAESIYGLRCSLMHQGHTTPKGGVKVAFTAPGNGPQLHNLATAVNGESVGWLSVEIFIGEVTDAASAWLDEHGDSQTVRRNLEKFARLRMDGLPPHTEFPVIA